MGILSRVRQDFGSVMVKRIMYVDGASRGNPGRAAIGVSLADENGNEIESVAEVIGNATNNEAEYRAVLRGLELAAALRVDELEIRTDSLLLAQQLTRKYKIRAANLKELGAQAQRAMALFERVSIRYIPRYLNRRADALANQALDEEVKIKQ